MLVVTCHYIWPHFPTHILFLNPTNPDVYCVGFHLEGNTPYEEFFYFQSSNSKYLIRREVASSDAPHPSVVPTHILDGSI